LKQYKILHFALGFIPLYGGNTSRLLGILSDDFHQHYLYVPATPSIFIPPDIHVDCGKEDFGHIHVRRARIADYPQTKTPVLDYLSIYRYTSKSSRLLSAAVQECDFNIVYGHSPLEFSLASLAYAKKRGLPLIYEAHSIKHDNLWQPNTAWKYYHQVMQRRFIKWEKLIVQTADIVIAQTETAKKRICALYNIPEDKAVVIYNGVETDDFDPSKWNGESSMMRMVRNWSEKFVILYAGQLDRTNGIDFLLDSIGQIYTDLRDKIRFVFIGKGELKDRIIEASNGNPTVEYLGLAQYDEMPKYLAACDMFCIPRPSRLATETFVPMKLLEAMAMAKPTLVSNVAGMTEIIQNGVNGFVFETGNQQDFINILGKLIANAAILGKVGKRAREDVLTRFTWNSARNKIQNVYESCCP